MRKVITTSVGILFLAGLVWMRGNGFARLSGGGYAWTSFAVDFTGFILLLVVLKILSQVIRWSCQRVLPQHKWAHLPVYVFGMIVLAFPLLLVTIQLHPPRVIANQAYTPSRLGLAYQNVTLQSDGLKLAAWFIPSKKPEQPIVLVTHGLGVDKSDFLFVAKPLHEAGFNLFTFDFRAHGESEGRTITFGLNEARDVKAAYDWLTKAFPSQPIYALGYSMGGAAVARAAADYGIFQRIVLDSTFSRFENVAKSNRLNTFGPLSSSLWQISRGWALLWTQCDFNDNDPARSLSQRTDARLLLIHGTADSIAPVKEAYRLKEATTSFSSLWIIEGSEHAQGHHQPDYNQRLISFLNQ
jgi:uncharacterized protein